MSTETNLTVKQMIDTDYHSYAMYVLENRAIPSYIDGLKPTHRKLLYAMLNEHKGKKTKVVDCSSISKFNYHHGEASAAGAMVTLTAEWNNNVPLFLGHGNFGSRLIQEAAAPRYIFASLNPEFNKYFSDFEVCDKNADQDNPEPQCYLPTIPWLLVNGIEGIAVGFSCRFLPHAPADLAKVCKLALSGKLKADHHIPVTFPGFKGEVIQESPTKVVTRGIVDRIKRNTWEISEAPWGFDREQMFNVLSKLMEDGKINDFEDNCNEAGFNFIVKLDGAQDTKCALNPIGYFKLERSFSENYTTLDETGKLRLFDTKAEIIQAFVDYRMKKVLQKITHDVSIMESRLEWYNLRYEFVNDVVNGKIDMRDYDRPSLVTYCKDTYTHCTTDGDHYAKLPNLSIFDMTIEKVMQFKADIAETQAELTRLKSLDPKAVYLKSLGDIK